MVLELLEVVRRPVVVQPVALLLVGLLRQEELQRQEELLLRVEPLTALGLAQ